MYVTSPVAGHLGGFCALAVINNVAINMGCTYLFKLMFLFPSDEYPQVELLDHMVILFLIFGGTSILFSIVAVLISISTNSAGGFLVGHPPLYQIRPVKILPIYLTELMWPLHHGVLSRSPLSFLQMLAPSIVTFYCGPLYQ